MAVQREDKYCGLQHLGWVSVVALLISILGLVVSLKPASADMLRKELQRSYDIYKQSALHYKVFALKHEGGRWDGWYTWGYNDLDEAIVDAVRECSKGQNVPGKCQVYGLGNEVVVGLEPLLLQAKIEEYRISGMVDRSYPKPAGGRLVPLGFSGNGHYFAGVLAQKPYPRLFIYDTDDTLWKHTFVLETDLKLQAGRSFSLSDDGKSYAFGRYAQSATDKGKSAVVVKGWGEESFEIPLANGAFWNGGCGLALSPMGRELAVCVDDGVTTRVVRYERETGRKLGEFNSARFKGKFDRTIAYSPDGKFLLVQGGRYQFDWVLKKNGQEAEVAWLFSLKTGELERSFEFSLAPGQKGPEEVGFTEAGHDVLVVTTAAITLHTLTEKKIFPRRSRSGVRALLSPHGVLAVADGVELTRYNIVGRRLVEIDSEQVVSRSSMLGFNRLDDRLVWLGPQEMLTLAAFRQIDLQSIALYKNVRKVFAEGRYKEAMVMLSQVALNSPRLPSEFSVYRFYRKYPEAPLAYFGAFYGVAVQQILDTSPKVSKIGVGYVKDSSSGLFFTTIKRIDFGTSVARSALLLGDRITHVNGTPVVLASEVNELLAPLSSGSRIELTYMRDGRIGKTSVVTEVGFRDTGKAAHVLLCLFDYGQLAAQAGHPGLVRLAAARLREISASYPSSFRPDLVEKLAVSLEALAFSGEGDMDTAFDLLGKSAPHPFQFRLFNPLVWGEFYKDRSRLATALGLPMAKLPKYDGLVQGKTQDFPDLKGLMIPAVVPPPLLR